jgi:hypothetical protein
MKQKEEKKGKFVYWAFEVKGMIFFGIKLIIIVNNKMSLIVRQMILEVECIYEGERKAC